MENEKAQSLFADEKFLRLLEAAPDAMILVDHSGAIVLVNSQTESLFSYKRHELIGSKVELLVPERFRKNHPVHRVGYMETAGVRPMGMGLNLFGLRADGSEFPVEISLSPIDTEEGRFIIAAVRDVAARRQAEEMFRGLLESAPDAMVIVDRLGKIRLVNSQTEAVFGYSREELIGERLEKLVPERYGEIHPKHRTSYFEEPRVRRMGGGLELFARRKDGSEFPVEISLSPLETEDGILVNAAIRDVSEMRRTEAIARMAEELKRSNAELEQFAYVASHDLQEPLRAVAGSVQMLQLRYEDKLDERANEFITHAVEGATRMQSLLNDLLTYSRVGTRGQTFAPTDFNKVVKAVTDDLAVAVRENNAVIRAAELPTLPADEVQMIQLFQNLIANAIKFKGDNAPQIQVGAEDCGRHWQFSIEDNGIGIDVQYADRVFVIFQRLHTRKEYPGTGIGLAICKRIVDRHNGKIWFESNENKGTTFFFTLPKSEQV